MPVGRLATGAVFSLAVAVFAIAVPVCAQVPSSDIPKLPDGTAVVGYLNQAIDWHRHLLAEEQVATDPSDVLFLNDGRQIANQVLQLSFDFAKADAELLAKQHSAQPTSAEGPQPSQAQSLAQLATSAAAEVRQRQAEAQSLRQQIASLSVGHKRRQLESQLQALESELELEQARSDTLHSIAQFVGGHQAAEGTLLAQIEELQRSLPELESGVSSTSQAVHATVSPSSSSPRPQPSGVVALVEDLFALRRKTNTLENGLRSTDALAQTNRKLRQPLVSALTAMAEQGDKAVQESTTTPADEKPRIEALTAQFKQVSALVLPLGKQAVLIDSYKSNLQRWSSAVNSQYDLDLKRLAVRLAILGIMIAALISLAEIWRKTIFRYVHDVRRRYQFLLLRRIVIWLAIAIAIAFTLASEVGSIATFVGLITAGIAVALQSLILAIAGYFFLIGKYGVRVGDRVQIGGVAGEVIDIGFVRLHLMEVSGADTGHQPTGRVVVFSNSIVFQPGASFYKQIPGTDFSWHQVSLTLAPNTDYQLAEKRLMEAVESVYASYREHMEHQHQHMQKVLNVEVALPKPQSRLHFTNGGLEILIRFPTELGNASQIDDQVTRRLLMAIEESPKLKLVGSGTPNIQPMNEEPQTKAS